MRLKSLVLTYDKNIMLTKHMILKYQKLWPNNNLEFFVPYQDINLNRDTLAGLPVVPIKSEPDIIDTLRSLTEVVGENELFYWCIDDKYPTIIKDNYFPLIEKFIKKNDSEFDGVLMCRARSIARRSRLLGPYKESELGKVYLRTTLDQIWLHQVLRGRVLRYLCEILPKKVSKAKEMDSTTINHPLNSDFKLLLSSISLIGFGESSERGILTKNCSESIKSLGLKSGALKASQNSVFINGRDHWYYRIYDYFR
jgi:hypothetical protein